MSKNLSKLLIIILFFVVSCSKKEVEVNKIKNIDLDEQMREVYNDGLRALESGDGLTAAQKFSEAEIVFPQSIWAPRSSLMTAYSYYSFGMYKDSIIEINRYLKTYPLHDRKNYAYYLLALSHYEQIVDEKKDLEPILNSKKYFEILIKDYPKSEFATDAKYKLELIEEFLASKEMYLGRYYLEKEKWIAAINRFKNVTENYDQTVYIEEALHRLVEIHYKIGLVDESKKYASLLGYNYKSSDWYEKSYKIFNKKYVKPKVKIKQNKKVSLIDKFKSLID